MGSIRLFAGILFLAIVSVGGEGDYIKVTKNVEDGGIVTLYVHRPCTISLYIPGIKFTDTTDYAEIELPDSLIRKPHRGW
jgi:hypothetical protein